MATFKRFPLSLISAIIGTVVAITMVEVRDLDDSPYLLNLIFTCSLGIPTFYCVRIFSETKKFSLQKEWLIQLGAVLLLTGYYFSLPFNESIHFGSAYIRYILFFIAIHLVTAFIPYLFKKEDNAFWQYNNIAFTRFITSVIFSGVIYLGLVLCLAAIDVLFNVNVHDELYADFWFICAGIFNAWYFFSGIPKDFEALKEKTEYPAVIKVFAQYIILPLVGLYLLILLSYEVKILTSWDWPKGIVAYMILGVSIVGILDLLLLHPLGMQGNKWVKTYTRIYYIVLIPLIVLLYLAIWIRVSDYGITENRYFLIVLSIWLNGITFYFLFAKNRRIELIPISLFVVTLLSSFGPWGAFAVSERSQMGRLEEIFVRNELLIDGKFDRGAAKISEDDEIEISGIVEYLVEFHDMDGINEWVEPDIVLPDSLSRWEKPREAVEALGFEYVQYRSDYEYVYYSDNYRTNINISGYDLLMNYNAYSNYYDLEEDSTLRFNDYVSEDSVYTVKLEDWQLKVYQNDSAIARLDMKKHLNKLYNKYPVSKYDWNPEERKHLILRSDRVKLHIRNMNMEKRKDEDLKLTSIDAVLLIKTKDETDE